MTKNKITTDRVHNVTEDIIKLLHSEIALLEKWNSLTPLAQNEWICWTTIAKKQETKDKRLQRMKEDLLKGKRRPCCWPGCPHRRPKAKKWFKNID